MPRPLLALLAIATALLADGAVQSDHVEAELVARETSVKPGRDVEIGLRFRLDEHWHLYWRNPGDAGEPPKVRWKLPGGASVSKLRWPAPKRVPMGPIMCYGYEDELLLAATIKVPPGFSYDTLALKAKVSWLACADVCIAGEAELELELPVKTSAPMPDERWAGHFQRAADALPEPAGDAVRVERQGDTIRIRVDADPAADAYFFSAEEGIVDAAAPQEIDREDGLVLSLPVSEMASAPPSRLKGVLVVGGRALAVDADIIGPVRRSPLIGLVLGGVALAAAVAFVACRFYCRP
ncbi:MAG: protein-disulfide reductase DsbD domain-containing protein [Planctomycetota bacterium]|jgi:thiol:disulfide interchange protein DsbD